MEPTRAAIATVHIDLKGKMSALIERVENGDPDATEGEFSAIASEGVWSALYILADHIDALRKG